MIKYNLLYNYRYKEGIKSVLEGMNRRTNNKGQIDLAIIDLRQLDKDLEINSVLNTEKLKQNLFNFGTRFYVSGAITVAFFEFLKNQKQITEKRTYGCKHDR